SEDKGAALFGYTKLYGEVPGGQAELLRVPFADYGPVKVPEGPPDDRFLFLSDVLPTAWQAVRYANVPPGDSLAVVGLGPVGKLAHDASGMLPGAVAAPTMERAGIDRLAALRTAVDLVRRGGTISIIGVYGGMADPLPMMTLFDKQVSLRMGQANVRNWIDD